MNQLIKFKNLIILLAFCSAGISLILPQKAEALLMTPEQLTSEIDSFLNAGASGYLYWQYSGDRGTGQEFASDQYSFFKNDTSGICAALKQSADKHPGKFIGVNMWDLGNHDANKIRENLLWLRENCGVTMVRTFAKAGGPGAVSKTLSAADGTGVKVIIVVGDYSNGSDGMPRGAGKEWFETGYKAVFRPLAQDVANAAKGKSALYGFELANEVHCAGDASAISAYIAWAKDISGILREASGNIGYGQKASENTTKCDSPGDRSFQDSNSISEINMTSAHYYNTSEKALALEALGQAAAIGKPFYIGEAGWGTLITNPQPGTVGNQCVGPIKTDQTLYRGQVIGHQDPSPDNKGPWQIYASATDEKEDEGDIVSAVVTERIVIAPTSYWSTDFSTMTQKFIGSLSNTNEDFIDMKAISQFKPSQDNPRSLPIYMTTHIPGFIYQGGFEIPAQLEKKGATETYAAFQARVYPSQDGIKPGQKSTIDNLASNQAFIGCLQASVCDPSTGEECLKNDKSGDKCAPTDPPEKCIGMGHTIKFTMDEATKIKLLEPADRQAMDKVLWDFSAAVVKKPGDTVPAGRSTILATSLEDYYAQEQQLLAKQNADKNSVAGVLPKNLTDTKKEVESSSLEKINPINPKKAQAAPPYKEDQPYCDGAHILIENKTAENQFSVKAWKASDGCPGGSDWGYDVQYYIVNKTTGGSRHIGGCRSTIHQSAEFPEYRAGSGDDEEYGVPLETLQGCSIPVTPRDLTVEEELQVSFHQLGGRAPYKEGCNQHFYCECPSESACGIKDDSPPPPIDCTKCETWAPAGECATMNAEDLLEVSDDPNCEKGFCQTGNQTFRLAKDIQDRDDISISVGNIFSDFIKNLYSAGAKLFNYHCEQDQEEGYTDINEVYHEGEDKWSCTFGERQYLLYGYVPSRFLGRLNQNRTDYDFQVFQGLYKVPGVSDSYFEPKPSKHEIELKLSLGDISGSNASGKNTTPNCGSNPLSTALGRFGLGGPSNCLDLSVGGSETRSMYIEYNDHFSQVAQYCLGEAAGSLPQDFPTRAIGLCEPFLSSLRGGGNFFSSAPGSNNISGDTLKQIENTGLESGVPARLIAVILDIEGGGSLNSCTRNSVTATGPFQITDDTVFGITDSTEQKNWNIQRWAAGTTQSEYRKDGRCNPQVAPTLAARVLKQKAGVDYRTGTISESNFNAVKSALRGYYGSCQPDKFTEGRWGTGIGYCDYGLFQMGLRQYCTGGQLSASCDNEGTGPITTEKSKTHMIAQSIMTPVKTKADPKVIQAQIAADLEEILNRYSKQGNFTMDTPIEQMPKGFKEEIENLQKTYKEKYDL